MLKYLEDFLKLVIYDGEHRRLNQTQKIRQVSLELERLDIRDFEPVAQLAILQLRGVFASYAVEDEGAVSETVMKDAMRELLPLLKHYRGKGTGITVRSFDYIADPILRDIIVRDYGDLSLKLFPAGAWKATVVMAGSVLEAILFDRLVDAKWNALAMASGKRPKKGGAPLPIDDWRLESLIEVALEIDLLPKDPANTIHQVLRDYRNFIHPKKEIRAAHPCTEAEAMLAMGALSSVCNYIERNH